MKCIAGNYINGCLLWMVKTNMKGYMCPTEIRHHTVCTTVTIYQNSTHVSLKTNHSITILMRKLYLKMSHDIVGFL